MPSVFLRFAVVVLVKGLLCPLQIPRPTVDHGFLQKDQMIVEGVDLSILSAVLQDRGAAVQRKKSGNNNVPKLAEDIVGDLLNRVMQIVIVLFQPLDLSETASDVAVILVVILLQALLGDKAPKLTFGNADTDVHRQNVVNALGGASDLKIDDLGDIPVHEAVQGTAVLSEEPRGFTSA